MIAKNRIEKAKLRAEPESRMLNAMKNGHTALPTYNDGDFWHFNVIEHFIAYDTRALKGVYELRYSDKGFQVFKGAERVTNNEGQISVLLAMVGQGRYMGGEYLKYPLNIGQKWSQQYASGVRGSRATNSWNSETTVKSVENVTNLAG